MKIKKPTGKGTLGGAFLLLAFLSMLPINGCITTGEIVLPDNPQSIAIPIVENRTFEYGAEERITDILIQEFLRDGRLEVVSREKADLLLEVDLTEYQLEQISVDNEEQTVVYRLNTALRATLVDQRSGDLLFEDEPFTESGVFFLSNEPSIRREETVYIRISEAMISRLLEGW